MSNLSDFLTIPLPGLTKSDDNTLQLLRPLPELRVLASDTSGAGVDAGVLRLRNVRQANGAGPNCYLEGTSNTGVVRSIGRMQAKFLDVTNAAEKTALVMTVLQAGAAAAVELRGDTAANFSPQAIAAFALGTQTVPWLQLFVGNAAGTRYVNVTPTGPAGGNSIVTEGGSLALYNGTQGTLVVATTGLTVTPTTLAGAASAVGVQTTIATAGGHSGDITGHAVTTSAQAGSGAVLGYKHTYSGASDYALQVVCGNPGDALEYGVYIDTTVNLNTAAFFQKQRAAAAGSFLVLQNSAGTALFTVDVSGNLSFGGDLTFSATGKRIKGDFSNATPANQVMFQSSTTNGATNVATMPNGTGTSSGQINYAGSDPANTNWLSIAATTTGVNINNGKTGTGTTQALNVQVDASTVIQLAANKDVILGLAGLTTLAAGLVYIPSAAGAPTGVPTVRAGWTPAYIDTTGLFLYFYLGGAWKKSTIYA